MVIKKKKIDTAFLLPKSYLSHPSKAVGDDALKPAMCKDLRGRMDIHKGIDKIEKSIKGPNTSVFKAKSSVKGLVKEFGAGLENNYYNFSKATVENPFSKYGVLLEDYKVKPRRKTHSAPSFLDFEESLIQKVDTTLEEDKMNRDTTGEAADNTDKFAFSIEDPDTHTAGTTNFLGSTNQRIEFNLTELGESYRNSLDSARTYKTDFVEAGKDFKTDYADTSREYKTEFADSAGSLKSDYVETSRTYKSDSVDTVACSDLDFVTTKIVYNPIDEMVRRLYKYTNNVFFDRAHTQDSVSERTLEDHTSPTESTAKKAILSQNPIGICEDLLERLESLVSSRPKRPSGAYSRFKFNTHDEPTHSRLYSKTAYPDSFATGTLSTHPGSHYAGSFSNTDYEETTLDVTPNKYSGGNDREDLLLKVSTESAKRAVKKVRATRRELKPYNPNDDFMLTDSEDYAYIDTKLGRIIYSPKLHDDKYMYRFVVLTSEAQKAVEILSKNSPKNFNLGLAANGKRLLTEYEIIKELGIRMSGGWHHFFYFKNAHKELILRKRL